LNRSRKNNYSDIEKKEPRLLDEVASLISQLEKRALIELEDRKIIFTIPRSFFTDIKA
jgi:hypothetical protein